MSGNTVKNITETKRLYCITGYTPEDINAFIKRLIEVVNSAKYAMIQVRSKHFSLSQYQQIIEIIMPLAKQKKVKILVNSDMVISNDLYGADGIHLSERSLIHYSSSQFSKEILIGSSCHNLATIKLSESKKVDFITLSPILTTRSHPEALTLRWELTEKLISSTHLKVYGLGGLKKQDLRKILSLGGYGIAAIQDFWG